eukprot:454848_1
MSTVWQFVVVNRLFLHCICCILLDLWLVYKIFTQTQHNDYKRLKIPKMNDKWKARWSVFTIRLEKSPFVLLTLYSLISSIVAFALILAYFINIFLAFSLYSMPGVLRGVAGVSIIDISFELAPIGILATIEYHLIYRITFSPIVLSWFNYADVCVFCRIGDHLNIITAHVWRACHVILCALFSVAEFNGQTHSENKPIQIGNWNYRIRVVFTWMLFQGLIWIAVYNFVYLVMLLYIPYKHKKEQTKIHTSNSHHLMQTEWSLIPRFSLLDLSLMILLLFCGLVAFLLAGNDNMANIFPFLLCIFYFLLKYWQQYHPISTTLYSWFGNKSGDRENILKYWWAIKTKEQDRNKLNPSSPYGSCLMWSIFIIFIAVIAAIPYNTFYNPKFAYEMKNTDLHSANMKTSSYPICDDTFADLNVLDLTLYTMIAYKKGKTTHEKILNLWFGENEWGKYEYNNWTESGSEWPTFFHVSNEQHKYHIISIRGTLDQSDMKQDLRMFTEIASLQFISFIIPLTTILPEETVIDIVSKITVPYTRFDDKIYDYILTNILESEISESKPDYTIYLVGHSLGGGIASIVAARFAKESYQNVKFKSFGVSSPGVGWSSKKFGFSLDDLDRTSKSVVPRRDIVPMFDRHGGDKQIIQCNERIFLNCHFVSSSFMELLRSCPYKYIEKSTKREELAKCIYKNKDLHDSCF